jgi:hypothetical protein
MAKVIEGTTYCDEIFPKDKNIATVSKPWIMARLADNVGTLANDLLIPSGLKITGVLEGQTPMTQIQQVATLEEYAELLKFDSEGNFCPSQTTSLTIRGATKSPVFSNLVFQYIVSPIDAQAPFESHKCKYDQYGQMFLLIDNRLTFLDPEDPCEVGMRKTIFDDCEFSNFSYHCMWGVVSGFEMTGCHVHDAPVNAGWSVLWFGAGDYWADQETLMTTLCSYNRVEEGCEFDHTNISELFCSVSLGSTEGLGTQSTNNIVTESAFTMFLGLACVEGGYASDGGQVSKCEISDNTFTKCDCPVFFDDDFATGGTSTVKDSIVADNTFIDQNLAPASSFWTGDPERFPNGVNGPAIWMQGCYKCQVAGNHYKQSGIEPDVDPYEAAIWLDYSSHCKVYEKKSDFPDNLPIEHWVGETESYNNSLNNGKPPKKHRGARCTYLSSKVGERHRELRNAIRRHSR